ncbi:sigma-54-dependent transcriptional regulator [Nitrospira moscoviensis]|uniref:Sigma54 dependent transcriptional regulator n=1 Tax=Nitrospira moscoviensis TaxID=42253 RepID=A0A0K2GHV0_NITMO|nr:sigma-54 dependent transcriptional regulator [Nitrospira moscoviensis]ALA60419.1 Sigma54 dependent transcriptional regulator [Nitrospira moscoviensis]
MPAPALDRPADRRRPKAPFSILIVEDNPTDVEVMLHALEEADLKPLGGDFEMEVRPTAEGALKLLSEQAVDLVLTDMMLPGMDGLDLLSRIQAIDRNLPVLVVTRMNAVASAVEAMRRGAFDYVIKPVTPETLGMRLHRAIRISEILRRHAVYEQQDRQEAAALTLVGESAAYERIMRSIQEAAGVRSTVLITGETGTGKGMIARAVHQQSPERDRPFQVIDCTSIPEGMMESELFGHVRGAFTGAVAEKPGLIELANGGTVFLDEIGELPLTLQAKLLRVLEENEVRPIGGTRVRRIDIRFIAATNQPLEDRVRAGTFRRDLYYRLAVVSIPVPPLRERRPDIPVMARHLLMRLTREMGRARCHFEESAIEALMAYDWPGNGRELRNVIEQAIMLAADDTVRARDILALLPRHEASHATESHAGLSALPYAEAKERAIEEFTKVYLREKLAAAGGVITKAAESSGIPRQHFSLLMKRFLENETAEGQ